jgi:hypothetical protein
MPNCRAMKAKIYNRMLGCATMPICRAMNAKRLTRRVDRLRPDRWTRIYSTKSVQLNGAKWSSWESCNNK